MSDTETGTPTAWDNGWREGHAHGLASGLGISYSEGWQRTMRMLAGEKLDTSRPGEEALGSAEVTLATLRDWAERMLRLPSEPGTPGYHFNRAVQDALTILDSRDLPEGAPVHLGS